MNNIVIVSQGSGKYLFSLPDNVTLKEGDRLKCSTKRGITDGIAFADSAWVDENVSQLIGKLTGAKFPLKSVAGKMEYLPFDKPQDKPANKYEGMSNRELGREMCTIGMCSARNDGRRKHDCLFADSGCYDGVTDANRAEVIKYLLSEDAAAAPKPEDKPAEDKQEPIKLYCVKNYISIFADKELVKGKVYEFDGHRVNYECSQCCFFKDFEDWKRGDPNYSACLFPLVKRPAKVGEWVYITKSCEERASKGKIYEVAPYGMDSCLFIKHPEGSRSTDGAANIWHSEYLVLDGYKPEPEAEPEPEYWSGKVVCVSSGDNCFAVGKMYEFVNGEIKDDEGDERPIYTEQRFKSVDEWNSEYGMPIARFVEFEGEAHD